MCNLLTFGIQLNSIIVTEIITTFYALMPTAAARFRNRFDRTNEQPSPSAAASELETLTVEQVLYEIELVHDARWVLGQRQGHSWYTEDGAHLAEASQIKAIRIPARQR